MLLKFENIVDIITFQTLCDSPVRIESCCCDSLSHLTDKLKGDERFLLKLNISVRYLIYFVIFGS